MTNIKNMAPVENIRNNMKKQRVVWRRLRTRHLRDKSDQELEGEPRHVDGLCQGEQGKVLTILSTFGLQFS